MGRWPGIADRLRIKLRERGYWNAGRDRPQLMRFAAEHGFRLMSVMTWIDGKQPSYENLLSLARALDTTPAELMFGEDGGRELVTSSPTRAAGKPSRPRRVDVATPIGARGHTDKRPIMTTRRRPARRGAAAAQLPLDLVAA